MRRKTYRWLFLALSIALLILASAMNHWPVLAFVGLCLILAGLNICVWLWSRTAVPKKREEERIRFA